MTFVFSERTILRVRISGDMGRIKSSYVLDLEEIHITSATFYCSNTSCSQGEESYTLSHDMRINVCMERRREVIDGSYV